MDVNNFELSGFERFLPFFVNHRTKKKIVNSLFNPIISAMVLDKKRNSKRKFRSDSESIFVY